MCNRMNCGIGYLGSHVDSLLFLVLVLQFATKDNLFFTLVAMILDFMFYVLFLIFVVDTLAT